LYSPPKSVHTSAHPLSNGVKEGEFECGNDFSSRLIPLFATLAERGGWMFELN